MLNVLYKHIFLEDTCTNNMVTKKEKKVPEFETGITHPCLDNKTLNLVYEFSKPLAVIS